MAETNVNQFSNEALQDALKAIASLRKYANDVEKAIEGSLGEGTAVNIMWGSELVNKAVDVFGCISKNNGAVLARVEKETVD